ncbi:MAG: hypothetical protein WDM78_13950 [Puia sp.]
MTVNAELSDTHHLLITLPAENKIARNYLSVKIDSPFIYMFENITPNMLSGNLNSQKVEITPLYYKGFIYWLPLSNSTMVVTTYDSGIHENVLLKLNSQDSDKLISMVLPKQTEGTFSTQGLLNFDKTTNRLVFVYLYRNEFYILDSNLTPMLKSHTIDTNTIAKIHIGTFDSGKYSTFTSPPINH